MKPEVGLIISGHVIWTWSDPDETREWWLTQSLDSSTLTRVFDVQVGWSGKNTIEIRRDRVDALIYKK